MSMKNSNPTSPGRRFYRRSKSETTVGNTPEKSLLVPLSSTGGRNNLGRITSRHRGGGHKRHYRVIDFKRDKLGVPGVVKTIEYDPNRSANIALIQYADGEKRYILAPQKLEVGDQVLSSASADIRPGNCLKLKYIPLGTVIHNIELKPGKGGQLIRSAGTWGQITAKEGKYALIRLPSGESRHVLLNCRATIGFVANKNHESGSLGKAGRSRWLGRRPHVRGVAMNPVDHPHGGGEGRTSGGRHPVTPWGVPTKGKKTRKNKRTSRFIVRGRKRRNK